MTGGVVIGADARPAASGTSNEIVLGYQARGLGSNSTVIGNSNTVNARIFGALNLPDATASTSSTTGALTVAGGVGIAKELNIGSTTASSSTTTGALIVSGGVGIAKEVNIGATTASTSTTTGALIVAGGVGIAKEINIGSTTTSTSPTTGALKVAGGAGIVGNVTIGGTLEIEGGTPGAGKVLVSDANGLASWSANSNGGVSSITATATMAASDTYNLIVFSGSTASQTITLPSAVTVGAGREITIKNIASVSVGIAATAGYLISDSSTSTATSLNIGIEPSNNWIKAISNGTNWIILRALF
jgi:hypothetical protein